MEQQNGRASLVAGLAIKHFEAVYIDGVETNGHYRSPSGATRANLPNGSAGLASAYARKVDIGIQRHVDRVGEKVEPDMGDDLDELSVRVTGMLDGGDIRLTHSASFAR